MKDTKKYDKSRQLNKEAIYRSRVELGDKEEVLRISLPKKKETM